MTNLLPMGTFVTLMDPDREQSLVEGLVFL